MTWRRDLPVICVLAAVLCLLGSGAARAEWQLCNKADTKIWLTIAYPSGQSLKTIGWFDIASQGCRTLLNGPLQHGTYYFRAEGESGVHWVNYRDGHDFRLCLRHGAKFDTMGWNCDAAGLESGAYRAICLLSDSFTENFLGSIDKSSPGTFGMNKDNKVTWYRGRCRDERISASVPQWYPSYAAFAKSGSGAWARSDMHPDQDSADTVALARCAATTGSQPCRILWRWGANQCFAAYESSGGMSYVSRYRLSDAQTVARDNCEANYGDCTQATTYCLPD